MQKNKRHLIIIGAILLGFLLTVTSLSIAADPTISVSPEKPSRKSTVTFTAEFDVDVLNAYLNYNECYSGGCYSKYNESMVSMGGNKFEAEVTLLKDDTTYIQYWIEYESADGWSTMDVAKTYLSTGSDGDSNDSPGFEFLIAVLSIALVVIVFRRKRMK